MVPHTSYTSIRYRPQNDTQRNHTSIREQALNGTLTFTVIYPGSRIISLDLTSFYFSCALQTLQGVVGFGAQCTISVAGFRNGQEVAVASFTYTLPAPVQMAAPMIEVRLPSSFVGFEIVTLIQGDPVTQVLVVDNIAFTIHP